MVRIMLIENHSGVREALRAALERQLDFEVVAEAATGLAGLDLFKTHLPDVVISAFALPDLNGADIAQMVSQARRESTVILFSLDDDPAYVAYAQSRGVTLYFSKLGPIDALFGAVRDLQKGKPLTSEFC